MVSGTDTDHFFDRNNERRMFEELLHFEDDARLLSICDKGGQGKSTLLKTLAKRCKKCHPRIPVCLIELENLEDKSGFGLIMQMYNQLTMFLPNFVRFQEMTYAMDAADFQFIRSSQYFQATSSSQYFQATSFQGASNFNIMANQANFTGNVRNVSIPSSSPALTPGQERIARDMCVAAFFDDLKQICETQTVVLILDTYEICELKLKNWFVRPFLDQNIFDRLKRPAHLLMVVAGREVPRYDDEWPEEAVKACVRPIPEMSQWNEEDIRQCLLDHGYPSEDHVVKTFLNMARQKRTPKHILHTMQLMFSSEAE